MGNNTSAEDSVPDDDAIYEREASESYARYGLKRGAPIDTKRVAAAIDDFGWNLLAKLETRRKNEGITSGCIAVSPVALATVLSSLAAGIMHGSPAGEEISDALQLPVMYAECLEAVGDNMRQAVASGDARAVLWMPMGLWANSTLRPDFVEFVNDSLGGTVVKVEAKRMVDTSSHGVNLWCADRSDGAISTIIPDGTKTNYCALTSGLHFCGQWATGFHPSKSTRSVFNITGARRQKQQIPCIMMHRTDQRLPYTEVWSSSAASRTNAVADPELAIIAPEGLVAQIVELPYAQGYTNSSAFSAYFILPAAAVPLSQL
eukprot:gene612-1039_t